MTSITTKISVYVAVSSLIFPKNRGIQNFIESMQES